MNNMKRAIPLFALFSLGAICMSGSQNLVLADERTPNKKVQEDNSKMNAMNPTEPTADQANNNLSDRETMQLIRKSIVADKSLSTYGHNVKVIAQNGRVTLKGTVHSQEEKTNIEAKASEVAGRENVINKIKIKGL